jgi:ABC-type multidrug transport system ATPase subunit
MRPTPRHAQGAGKTTVIGCMTGQERLDSGDATIHGHSVAQVEDLDAIAHSLGVCPQETRFSPDTTLREVVHLFALLRGISRRRVGSHIAHVLKRLRIT